VTASAGTCRRCGARLEATLALCPRCLLGAELEPVVLGGTLELGEEIGRGGMGTVYAARHKKLGRMVAVKLLTEELAARPELRARFEREARALALLNHPNIVSVFELGDEDGQAYMVLELVEGGSLERALPVSLARALEIAVSVCDALAYAHVRGVVHRDIKPGNILLDASGRVKVADFGIARILDPDGHGWTVTAGGEAVGTPHYMAPEALAGAAPDARMDLYSLGVVLYEMATGHLPIGAFAAPPREIEPVVRRALAQEPGERYASAEAMRQDLVLALERVRGAAPGETTPAELPPDEQGWVHAVALLQAVSTGVALWAFLVSVRPRVMSPDEVLPLVMLGAEKRPDGKILSLARFEVGPTLATLATFAVAIACYALLRGHWRRAGLEVVRPGRAVPQSRLVLLGGAIALIVYGARKYLEALGYAWATIYIPILGGAIEIAILFFFWVSILEAWRTARPLRREPMLWLGFGLALLPPAVELILYLRNWQG
jgi:serine/threonine-protein kinase